MDFETLQEKSLARAHGLGRSRYNKLGDHFKDLVNLAGNDKERDQLPLECYLWSAARGWGNGPMQKTCMRKKNTRKRKKL